jgi:hypothetical protein
VVAHVERVRARHMRVDCILSDRHLARKTGGSGGNLRLAPQVGVVA